MNLVNLIVDCRVQSLHRETPTMQARLGSTFVLRAINVPDDVTDVTIRVSTGGGAGFFDIPCTQSPNGDWRAHIIGTAFASVGREWYEIRGRCSDGSMTALAKGACLIDGFSADTAQDIPLDPERRVVQTLLDESGAQHQIVAVKDEFGEWTYRIADTVK